MPYNVDISSHRTRTMQPIRQSPAAVTPLNHAGPFMVYCDGACKGNPGPGGWGVSLADASNSTLHECFGGQANVTNNQMELTAAIVSLRLTPVGAQVTLHTDSQYVEKGLASWMKGWKGRNWRTASGEPVKNKELWQELDALYQARKVKLVWVRGHNGHDGNERADTLANMGVATLG